jgi:hypothetical protein
MRPYDIGLAERQIEAYGREIEQWRRDHDAAMRCRDFELLLKLGLDIYETIGRIDAETSGAVHRGEREPAALEAIDALYRLWLAPAEDVQQELNEFERSGFHVDFADAYRSACREVQGILTADCEFFTTTSTTTTLAPGVGDLVALRDAAIDAHRRDETEPFAPEG